MTSILGRYLAGAFIGHLLLILFSAIALLQLFDVMSNADDLLRDLGGGFDVILRYSLLRLPSLATFLTPFCVLIAALMTFGRLHRHSELVAIQALGVPMHRVLLMLLPTMMAVAFLDFLIGDLLAPKADRALAEWQASAKTRKPNDIALWLRDNGDLVSVGAIEDDGRRLEDVVIFQRDEGGNLTMQRRAARATFDEDGWRLHDVRDFAVRPAARRLDAASELPWATELRPDLVEDLAATPNVLSVARLKRLLRHPEVASRPAHVYETWLHKSFAAPLASIFMTVLAAASVRGLHRQGNVAANALIGFGGAFLYFVADGMLQAFGEAGSVRPAIAAWLPLLILALIAAAILYWIAMPRGRRRPGAPPHLAPGGDRAAAA
jgi:lipopolysaccharide export system permease protein